MKRFLLIAAVLIAALGALAPGVAQAAGLERLYILNCGEGMPDGQQPADPKATHWYRPKTLASQLEALGVQPADITFVAVSHTHGDHIGNVELFPQAMLLVQKA